MLSLFERWLDKVYRFGFEYFGLFYGVYKGTCMENDDPEQQGKIRVRVPAVSGNNVVGSWAWPISTWAGKDSGFFCVPDVGDPVCVMFENGKGSCPMWLGGWWPKVDGENNFAAGMGAYNGDGGPTKRIFKTKAGHELSFEDDPDNLSVKLVWHNKEGDKHSFVALTGDGSVQMANHKGCFLELRAKPALDLL